MNTKLVILLISFVVLFSGCKEKQRLASVPGNYTGFIGNELVTAQISKQPKSVLRIEVRSVLEKKQWALSLYPQKGGKIGLVPPAGLPGKSVLKAKNEECFESLESNKYMQARLCFNGTELSVELYDKEPAPVFELLLERANRHAVPVFEQPRNYKLEELLTRTSLQNFETRAGFERVLQSRLAAKNAYDKLWPHLSFNTVFSAVISLNISTAARAVGDLVPFLFPTRRKQAGRMKFEAKADYYAWILTKADATNIVEGLALSTVRDTKILAAYARNRAQITEIRDEILDREKLGLMQPGSADDLNSVLNALSSAELRLTDVLRSTKASLAQASGFFNARAIRSVIAGPDPLESEFRLPTLAVIQNLVFKRSYELLQLDALVEASKKGSSERYYAWFNPSASDEAAFGLGFSTYRSIGESHVRELIHQRQGVESLLLQKLESSLSTLATSKQARELSGQALVLQQKRLERLREKIALGISFPLIELLDTLQQNTRVEAEGIAATYSYAIAQAQLNRLMFIGPYAGLTFAKPRQNP